MLRLLGLAVIAALFAVQPASALTQDEKMETCKFGADNQNLTGAKRTSFIKNCMANRDDKRGPAPKAAAKPAAATPAAAPPPKAPY